MKLKCYHCNKEFVRYDNLKSKRHFCSQKCYGHYRSENFGEWVIGNKTALRNRNPEFAKLVSEGLKKRKQRLGDNYHSIETKRKIGKATQERWESIKHIVEPVLKENAKRLRRSYKIDGHLIRYGWEWKRIKQSILNKKRFCARCGGIKNLDVHHILPFQIFKSNNPDYLEVLCHSCHKIVEIQQHKIYQILKDWMLIAIMVKAELNTKRRFYCDVIRQRYERYMSESVRK